MPVAIRAATRIQDMDDANVSLGVGVDEYALVYDHDTARFVLRAPFAGLLATGATTGATSQAQTFTNGIVGPSWKPSADSTTALQLQNVAGTSVLNVDTTNGRVALVSGGTYYIGSRQVVSTYSWGGDDRNVWLGGAVNTSVTGTAGHEGNYNNAIGVNALYYNTTGYYNNAIGVNALYYNTTGYFNNAIGVSALQNNTTGYYNNAIGVSALYYNTTGNYNNAIGVNAGRFIADGSTPNETSRTSLYFGAETRALANGDSNEIVIGHAAIGLGSNSTTIGNESTTLINLFGALKLPNGGIRPAADSTTALQLQNAAGTSVLNVDTTNGRVGIGTTSPATRFDIDAGALTMAEMTAPTGVADKAMLYTKDNGSGKTQLCCKLGDNVEIVIATQA